MSKGSLKISTYIALEPTPIVFPAEVDAILATPEIMTQNKVINIVSDSQIDCRALGSNKLKGRREMPKLMHNPSQR